MFFSNESSNTARAVELPVQRTEVLLAILTDLSIDHRCYKLAKSLKNQGMHPVIYCDRPLHALGSAWDEFDVRVLTSESHLRRFMPVFVAYLFKLLPVLLRTRARLWISLDAPPLFWLALWGKLRGRMVVYDSHELFIETPMVQGRPSRRWFWTAWERGGFDLITRAMTVSPAILERLRAAHPRVKFHLLPNMPFKSESPVTEKTLSKPLRLIFQGGLRVATGLPEFFEALRLRPGYEMDVFGGGSEEAALRAAAKAAGLDARVRFHGSVPFQQLAAPMAAAHIGIHLMQPVTGSFALTWANKIFDYAQALTPMLLSDNPAHRALLEEFRVGVVVDSFSPEAIGEGLDRLAADYAYHLEECRKAREAWHWEAYARGLPEFLGTP
jgi:glycosyltransferase involved in cell wall biosynthesis